MSYWYSINTWSLMLLPISWLFGFVVMLRRWCYRHGIFSIHKSTVPVWVVGNVFVGGVGKTPLVIELVRRLQKAGLHPAVVSRGYGGSYDGTPSKVISAQAHGDEPALIDQKCGAPVYVARRRAAAVAMAVEAGADIVISDDGLQHYAMDRDRELVVVDATRLHGNGFLLPAGPLREPKSRLKYATVIYRGANEDSEKSLCYEACLGTPRALNDPQVTASWNDWNARSVVAIAGIGHPEVFFEQLKAKGLSARKISLADHEPIPSELLAECEGETILVTEKDAIKMVASEASKNVWVVPLEIQLGENLARQLDVWIEELVCHIKS